MPQSRALAIPERAVVYARFSSDNQREASIDDQVRICRALAERQGLSVGEIYADYAISGATAARPRFQQLLTDARAGCFQVVLAEGLDRLSRDQEHIAAFHKQMSFMGVRVLTVAEGEISELHVGLKGTMSALFLKDLAQKTHRGVEGRIRAGASGGGLSYGYRVVRALKADGTPVTGQLEIQLDEAAIIQRIFRSYADGVSPRLIARSLNADRIPGPRGGQWTAALLLGGAARESGLLRNRLYVGERVWNRQKWIKDPSNGRRVARLNPREAWVVAPAPELALIDQELWDRVQQRLECSSRAFSASPANADLHADHPETGGEHRFGSQPRPVTNTGQRLAGLRRPRWPLSGLVRCGRCQGPMTVMGAGGRLGCANHVERGSCDNQRSILRDKLLGRVLTGLKEKLLAPDLLESFVRGFVEEVNAANRERGARHSRLESECERLERQLRNLLDLIKEGHGSPAMVAELREVERRRETVRAELSEAGQPEPVPVLHPNLPALYRRRVEMLESALQDPELGALAVEALRSLIEGIDVHPGERRGEVFVVLRGDLATLLEASQTRQSPNIASDIRALCGVMATLDAGTGFEPVTFRL